MLTNNDIDYIRKAREEIRENRTVDVTIAGRSLGAPDPVTGEREDNPYVEVVPAVVTQVSVRTAVDRYIVEGIEIRTGDIIVDISRKDVPEDITSESVESVTFDGIDYQAITPTKLGLGGYNRMEIIARRIR